jgi:ribosomal protein L37AE/L43A
MAKLLHLALSRRKSLILVTAPKFDQVKNIAFKHLTDHLLRLKAGDPALFRQIIDEGNLLRTVIRLRNGSTILAESPVPETIRGHTATAIYIMEANFIRDDRDLYTAVLFTLNTTNGYIIAESTPWNADSVFHAMIHDPAYNTYSRHLVPYTAALPPNGPLTPDIVNMIHEQLQGDPARWKREMLCEWTDDQNAWLPTPLIALAQDSDLSYTPATEHPTGDYYLGVDLGKHRDPSVVAVVEKLNTHLYLRHLHAFPLETSYGAVIGYVKRLQDNWKTIHTIHADNTGVGDYIVEDMRRGGLRGVEGVNFTEQNKEAMATELKETMRRAVCPTCHWTGHVDTEEGEWRTTCPTCGATLRPLLHIPYDPPLLHELNAERYELGKTGRLLFNHAEGTHDDRFWALALAVHAADARGPTQKPLAKI